MFKILCFYFLLIHLSLINCNSYSFKKCKCQAKTQNRIVGGEIADSDDYPWQVSLGKLPELPEGYLSKNSVPVAKKLMYHFCSGMILNERWILTAAHCVVDFRNKKFNIPKSASSIGVGFGNNHSLVSIYNNGRTEAESIYIHPDYTYKSASSRGDIALIKLNRTIDFESESVEPACLLKEEEKKNYDELIATGWGSVNRMTLNIITGTWFGYQASEYLKEAVFKDTSSTSQSCQNRKDLICINSFDKNDSTCKGDSGGPLHYESKGSNYVIGITSFGGAKVKPPFSYQTCNGDSAYTKISSHINWVQSVIKDDICLF